MILRRFLLLGLFAASLVILTPRNALAPPGSPSIVFKNGTPKAGSAAGKIDVDVEWKDCTDATRVEGQMYKVTFPGGVRTESAISTKAMNGIGANGTKSWTWDGLTTGDTIVVYADVYSNATLLVEKKSADVTVP